MVEQVRIGPHLVLIEDDLLTIAEQRVWIRQEMAQLLSRIESILEQHGRVFIIDDLSHGLSLPAETRRYAIEWLKEHRATAVALVGPNTAANAFVQLVLRAAAFLGANVPPLHVCKTLEEARAWIGEQRQAWSKTKESSFS